MNGLRILLLTLSCGILLWLLQAQANHYLSSCGLSLHLHALLVAFAALRLPHGDGWRTCLLFGLWCDAAVPVPFGLHALVFLVLHALVHRIRSRIPREETFVGVGVALVATVGIILSTTLALGLRLPTPIGAGMRIASDTLASLAVVGLIAPWFFALCERVFSLVGINLRREQRGFF